MRAVPTVYLLEKVMKEFNHKTQLRAPFQTGFSRKDDYEYSCQRWDNWIKKYWHDLDNK